MRCETQMQNANYGKNAYCKVCGMDLDFNPVTAINRGYAELFCCEECAKAK